MGSKAKKLNVLQAFRAIFIILICIEHMALNNKLSFLGAGSEGVSFFLVLSGFLTGYIYRDRPYDCSVKGSVQFVKKKLKKFYPLHLTAIVLSLLLQVLYIIKNFGMDTGRLLDNFIKAVLDALFLQVYIPVKGWYINDIHGVGWFLSLIVFCYAFSFFGLFLIKRAKEKNKSILLFAAALLIYLAVYIIFGASEMNTFVLYVFPPVRFLEYFMAMMMGYYYSEDFAHISGQGVATGLIEVISVVLLIVNHTLIKTGFYAERANINYLTTLAVSLLLVFVFSHEKGIISKALNRDLLVTIGDLSFYIYIMHQVIIKYVATVLGWNNLGAIVSAFVIIGYTILIKRLTGQKKSFRQSK